MHDDTDEKKNCNDDGWAWEMWNITRGQVFFHVVENEDQLSEKDEKDTF